MWHKFNPNPHGSSVGDCAVRAVAAATGQSWEQAYIALALTGYALGDMPSANRTWGAYLQKQGYKRRMVEAASAAPFGGLMEVLDEHMSAIKLAYPKEYELVMRKITAL